MGLIMGATPFVSMGLLFLCVAVGVGARTYKNRSGIGWFFISFLVTPFLGFLILLACRKLEEKPMPTMAEHGRFLQALLVAGLVFVSLLFFLGVLVLEGVLNG